MARAGADWSEAIAVVAAEPGGPRLGDPRLPVLLWDGEAGRVLHASPAGAEFSRGFTDATGAAPRLPDAARHRLRALAAGLAPRSGYRLEKIRFQASRLARPLTVACRLVSRGDETALLTAILDPAAARSPGPAAATAERPPEPPDASRALPRPDHVPPPAPDVRPAVRGRRFTWRADAAGRFTRLSPELAEIVGEEGAAVLGSRWDDLAGDLVDDPKGEVAAAFTSGAPWTRLPAGWRDPTRNLLVPIEISGSPVFGPDGGRTGFRGFAAAFAESAAPAPPRRPRSAGAPPQASTPPDEAPGPQPEAASDEAPPYDVVPDLERAAQAAAALSGTAGETVFGMLRAWFAPQAPQAAPGNAEAGSDRDASEERGHPALTSTEQGALHEIARALGGTASAPEDATRDAPRLTAEIVPLPTARAREPEAPRLLDAVPLGLFVLRDGAPLHANRWLLDRLDRPTLPDLVATGGLSDLLDRDLAAFAAAEGALPVSLPAADGTSVAFEAAARRIAWGELPALLVSLSHPPDRSAEAEARSLAHELAARTADLRDAVSALDLSADGALTIDLSARILSLTGSAERLFGYAANEVVGDSLTALLLPEDHRAVLGDLDMLRRGETGRTIEREVRARPRGRMPILLVMRASSIRPGPDGVMSVAFRDVTRLKALESDLREARLAAERESSARGDFLARISHEIRTPLTAITGFAELILAERFGPVGNDRYKEYVRDIAESGSHVLSLVNDLLDLAKVTAGSGDLRPTSIDLNALARQGVALSGALAARERAILRTSFPPGLPRVYVDERSVRQIILNVLSNAIRFTGAGSQVIVSTTAAGPGGDVVLSVRDTGAGMSHEEIEAALTPFRQVATARRGDGTGLGLPLSKALTEANGGAFAITSSPGLGTLVEVRLPIAAQTDNADSLAAE